MHNNVALLIPTSIKRRYDLFCTSNMDQSDAYSMASQNTKDNRKLVWEDRILVAAAEKVETFDKITQPRDTTTGEPVDVGSFARKGSNKYWRGEARGLGADLRNLTEPAPDRDTRSEASGKRDAKRPVAQYLAGYAAGKGPLPQRVLVEEAGPKLGPRASQRLKKQLGNAEVVKVEEGVGAGYQGPKVPAKRVVSKKQIQKNAAKQEVIEEPVEVDIYGVREVLDRSALAFSDCMNTFNTVRFCRGGVSGTGFFKTSTDDLVLIAAVNQSDVGSGAVHRSSLKTQHATRATMGKQADPAFFDVEKALEGCILPKHVSKYIAAQKFKKGFVRSVVANHIMCMLFGMGYSNLDPPTRATLLNIIMRHGDIRTTKQYVWVKMVGAFKSICY